MSGWSADTCRSTAATQHSAAEITNAARRLVPSKWKGKQAWLAGTVANANTHRFHGHPHCTDCFQNARKCSQSFSIAALYFEHCPFLRPQAAQCVAWLTSLFDDCSDSQADSWTSHGIAHPGARPRACEQTAPTTNAHQNFRSWPYRFELFVQYARIIHISRACRSLEPKKASSSLTTSAF